jgi:lysophospholipase L1-like esterase
MPASGVSGVDLYAHDGRQWRWAATHQPAAPQIEARLLHRAKPGVHRYHLNLPLYNGVKKLEIGVEPGSRFNPVRPRREKAVLFYGTSITQGGCASRPGMNFVSILGRRLDRPMLNFGFSGNGRMELEVGRFLAELDPSLYVIDCSANTTPQEITERCEELVKILREAHAQTPILLLDGRRWEGEFIRPSLAELHQQKQDALRGAFERLQSAGVEHLHYRVGDDLLGDDGEGTVDGSHPTDLGFVRFADALEPELRGILGM